MGIQMTKEEMLAHINPVKAVTDEFMCDLGIPPGPAKDCRAPANPSVPEFHSAYVDYNKDPVQCGPIAQASNYLCEKLGLSANINLEMAGPEVPVIDWDTPGIV